MDHVTRYRLAERAYLGRKEQIQAVSSAILKLELMELTLDEGMVECPPPSNIHPLRWRAMLRHFSRFQGNMT